MFFRYDPEKSIHVSFPFSRVMTPYMMPDTAGRDLDFSLHMAEWQPGAEVDEHAHESGLEAMYCLSGSGIARVNGEEFEFVADTMIAAAPGERHYIKNTGDAPMRVLCIFSPPMTAQGLRDRAKQAMDEYEKNGKK